MIEIRCEKGIYEFHIGVDLLYRIDDSFYLHSEGLGTEILLASYPEWGESDMASMDKFLYETDRGLRNITQISFDKNAIRYEEASAETMPFSDIYVDEDDDAEDDYDWEDDLF